MIKYLLYKFPVLALLIGVVVSCGKSDEKTAAQSSRSGSIIETGEVVAVNSWNYTMPRFGRMWHEMKIIGLLEHGAIVNEGDSIVQFDPANVNKTIVNSQDRLEVQLAALEKMYVDHDNRIKDFESSIKNGLATFDLKKIDLEASKFEPEKTRRIKQLEFRQAEITLAKERRRIEFARVINASDLSIQKIRVRQIENDIQSAKNVLTQLTVRTPVSGVFQIAKGWSGGRRQMLKVGNTIYSGNLVVSVPEIKWMKVEAYISETDLLKVNVKQKVAVRLDALPKVIFDGEVTFIGRLCHYKDNNATTRQKVFDVEIKLLAPDERLKPGMTVSCEFL